jgi:hypothetical protein
MPAAEGRSMLRRAAAVALAAALPLGGCILEARDDGTLPDTDVFPDADATGDFDESDAGATDVPDVGPETAADDVPLPDVAPDADLDVETDSGLPGPEASCAELSDWILEYTRTHGACTSPDECVAATDIYSTGGCRACYFLNADLVDGRMYSPALRTDAVTAEFASVRERFWTECAMSFAASVWHWSCIYDGVVEHVEIDCVSDRCVANAVHGPCEPRLDGGGE